MIEDAQDSAHSARRHSGSKIEILVRYNTDFTLSIQFDSTKIQIYSYEDDLGRYGSGKDRKTTRDSLVYEGRK